MIKRVAVLFVFLFIYSSVVFAQRGHNSKFTGTGDDYKYSKDSVATLYDKSMPKIVKPSRDFLMLQLGYNNWASKPDSVKTKSVGYVFNAYLCYDFPIKKSNFSFAAGLGINASAVYLDHQVIANRDTGAIAATARIMADTSNFKRYKFTTTYLQAPFELRYFSNMDNRNRGFKAALGITVGTLLGSDSKAVTSAGGTIVKEKDNTKRYVSPWNFAATARVGIANFSIFASYNITTVFKENSGPSLTPFSLGICVTGL